MSTRAPIPLLLAALLTASCVPIHADQPEATESVAVHPTNDEASCASRPVRRVIEYANAERRARNLPELECSPQLVELADAHARDMCERQYVGHVDPDGVGPQKRFDAHGVEYTVIGENVAHGQRRAYQVHAGWMESRGHRKNILRAGFRRIGVAVRWCDGRPYWAQMFAGGK
jgi:uncharacterized protein YkwD